MNFKKTLLLAFVLLAAITYLTKVSEPRRKAELEREKLFSALDVSTVERIEALPKASAAYTVMRGAAENGSIRPWALADLPSAKLDTVQIEGILTTLKGLTLSGPIPDSEVGNDFSTFGLNAPELTLVIQTKDGAKQEIAFGKKYEFLMGRYAKVSGQGGLFIADESAFPSLNKSRLDIRSRQPISFKTTDVREATLETSLGKVAFTQPAVGEWKVLTPSPRDGSNRDIEQLFSDVRGLVAEEFIDGGQNRLGEYGLDKPATTVTVKLRDGLKESSYRVLVGEAPNKSGTYFTYDGAPSVFKIAPEKAIPLKKGVIDLRERKLLRLSDNEIEKVVSAGTAESGVDIQAAAMDWTVNGKMSDPVFVEQLLKDICDVSAVEFPQEFPSDAFNQPYLTLTITKKKGVGGESVVLMIGKEIASSHGPVRYARVGEQGEVSLIRDIEAKRIVPHEGALIQRATPSPAPNQGDKSVSQ